MGLAWEEEEKGRFSDEYFLPVKIPIIEHIPWAHKNLPIPAGILNEVIKIFKDKTATGVYEHCRNNSDRPEHQSRRLDAVLRSGL
jgi:hypothetical protein